MTSAPPGRRLSPIPRVSGRMLPACLAFMADQTAVAKCSELDYRGTAIEEDVDNRKGHTDQTRKHKARPGTGLAHARELSGRWSVPRCMPWPLVPCPSSGRAWH